MQNVVYIQVYEIPVAIRRGVEDWKGFSCEFLATQFSVQLNSCILSSQQKMTKYMLLPDILIFWFTGFFKFQDWKIGRNISAIKLPKSAKKLFGAPVYTAVKYPAYNVPVNQ